ncbi:MAG: hypothetical protein J5I93_15955 [Pirellulaceae bacterium]|nr:hypothetical protein [Pirellulaceae bacterium]
MGFHQPVAAAVTDLSNEAPFFPCRLAYVSTTSCKLAKHNGRYIRNPLSGNVADIDSEPTISNSSFTVLNYVYLDCSAATLTKSTTAPTTTNGIEHMTGDTDNLLVGWVYPNGSNQFADSLTERLVMSKFHRLEVAMKAEGAFESNMTANGTWRTPGTRMLLSWLRPPDEDVTLMAFASLRHDASGGNTCRLGIDIGLTGTPQTQKSVSADSYKALSCKAIDVAGSVARRQAEILYQGVNVSPNKFDSFGDEDRLVATLKR